MNHRLPRRSLLIFCLASGAAAAVRAGGPGAATPYLATLPPWGLRPGSGEDQSDALQALIDTASQRGGGTIVLPNEHEGVQGSYLVQDIRPRSNVLIEGTHGTTLKLPDGARAHLIDNHGEFNLHRFVMRGLTLDGGGAEQTLVRIKRHGSGGYAWDQGGMYDVTLQNAAIGAEVEWSGQVYYRGGRVQNCREGLRLTHEHLYLQDITFWGCRTGVFAQSLLHTHWDHLVFAHGGADSTAVQTPGEGGPHIQESRLVNCEVIDYRRGMNVRYLLDTEISGWRFRSIDFEGILADFSGMVELRSCRFLDCGSDASKEYSAMKIVNSTAHAGWRIYGNVARSGTSNSTMKYGFDLAELANVDDAVVGHSNIARNASTAGYLTCSNHRRFNAEDNVGTFATASRANASGSAGGEQ